MSWLHCNGGSGVQWKRWECPDGTGAAGWAVRAESEELVLPGFDERIMGARGTTQRVSGWPRVPNLGRAFNFGGMVRIAGGTLLSSGAVLDPSNELRRRVFGVAPEEGGPSFQERRNFATAYALALVGHTAAPAVDDDAGGGGAGEAANAPLPPPSFAVQRIVIGADDRFGTLYSVKATSGLGDLHDIHLHTHFLGDVKTPLDAARLFDAALTKTYESMVALATAGLPLYSAIVTSARPINRRYCVSDGVYTADGGPWLALEVGTEVIVHCEVDGRHLGTHGTANLGFRAACC
jgi:hypothetical protein